MSTQTPPATTTPSISLVPVDSIEPQYVVEGTSTKVRNNVHAKYVRICYRAPADGVDQSIGINQSVVFGLKAPAPLVFVGVGEFYQPTVTGTYDTRISTGTFRYGVGSSDTRRVAAKIFLNEGQGGVLTQFECTVDKIHFSEKQDKTMAVVFMKDTILHGKKCDLSICIERCCKAKGPAKHESEKNV